MTKVRRRIAIGGTLLGLALATFWMVQYGTRGAEIANVFALPFSVLSFLVALGAKLAPSRADDPVVTRSSLDRLRSWSAMQETGFLRRALFDAGELTVANVRYGNLALGRWRTDGGTRRGSVKDIAAYYKTLERGRFVVLGEPGAGKTVALSALVLDLIRTDSRPSAVPARVSLPTFDLGPDSDAVDDITLSSRLRHWMITQIATAAKETPRAVRAMLDAGMILPVLDGLDEMDAQGSEFVRARAVIRALNCQRTERLDAVVIACRSERYRQLGAQPGSADQPPVLQDASAVVLEPLTIAELAKYITRRFPAEDRWSQLIDALKRDPTGPVATKLRTPLHLFLATTAYANPASQPLSMLKQPDTLDNHLFSKLVPATIGNGTRSAHYDADDAQRWMRSLADPRGRGSVGPSSTDLPVHRIGSEPRPSMGHELLTIAQAVLVGSCMSAMLAIYSRAAPYKFAGYTLGILSIAALLLTAVRSAHPDSRIRLLSLRQFRDARARGRFAGGSLLGAFLGAAAWGVSGSEVHPLTGAAIGLVFGAATAVVVGARGESAEDSVPRTPGQALKQVRNHYLATGLAIGSVAGIGLGPVLMLGVDAGTAAACGILIGITSMILFTADHPWPHYLANTWYAAHRGRLPRRNAQFLDWACEVGLLRMVNLSVQFRHQELQAWLLRQPGDGSRPDPEPSRGA